MKLVTKVISEQIRRSELLHLSAEDLFAMKT